MYISSTVDGFLSYLNKNGYSPLTNKYYKEVIEGFINHSGVTRVEKLSLKHLTDYRDYVSTLPISEKTKNLRVIPIRRFLQYLSQQRIAQISHEPLHLFRVKNGKKPFDLIDRKELSAYLSFQENPRNDLVVNMLYGTGLRVAELCSLKLGDVRREFSIKGKGGRIRTVFLDDSVWKKFEEYRKTLPPNTLYVFGMTTRTVERIVYSRGVRLGMSKKMTPHVLRHLYATHLYENGADILALQQMLGHASLATTQIYTHVNTDKMRETYKKFHGLKP